MSLYLSSSNRAVFHVLFPTRRGKNYPSERQGNPAVPQLTPCERVGTPFEERVRRISYTADALGLDAFQPLAIFLLPGRKTDRLEGPQ